MPWKRSERTVKRARRARTPEPEPFLTSWAGRSPRVDIKGLVNPGCTVCVTTGLLLLCGSSIIIVEALADCCSPDGNAAVLAAFGAGITRQSAVGRLSAHAEFPGRSSHGQ